MSERLRLYSNPSGLDHDTGDYHPENRQRLISLRTLFTHDYPQITHIEHAPAVSLDWLKTIHAPNLIEFLKTSAPARIDGDTVLSPGSWQAALDAAALACAAIADIQTGHTDYGFCALRPPGHHAEYDRCMGFCLLNHAYIAAIKALESDMCQTIAIIDWDVHHGNGTEHLIRNSHRGDIHYLSTHEWPLFPGTGGPDSPDHPMITNCPLPSGSGSAAFRDAFEQDIIPALQRIAPDLIIVSAGFDAHRDDPLAGLNWDEQDYEWATGRLRWLDRPMLFVLEGGYDLSVLENSVSAVLDCLLS